MGEVTRDQARALLFEFTQSDALRKHGRAVEEAMRAYARWFGQAATPVCWAAPRSRWSGATCWIVPRWTQP